MYIFVCIVVENEMVSEDALTHFPISGHFFLLDSWKSQRVKSG
jgi:hypothetical protein